MNMRMDPDDLARVTVGLFAFDTDLVTSKAHTPSGVTQRAWWLRFAASCGVPLPPPTPELCLLFADTEATWCLR
jgi:hypothetical protein